MFLGLYSKITEQGMLTREGKSKPKQVLYQSFCSVVNSSNITLSWTYYVHSGSHIIH